MKYSIIIPVYNCVNYLEDCIASVFKQTSDSEYEIILVNDGSTDESPKLCDQLAKTYDCIRVIHQTNQGVSAARNAGIAAAQGEYLLFLDSDDFWHETLLEHVDDAVTDDPDIVEFGYRAFYESGKVSELLPSPVLPGENGKDYVTRILDQGRLPVQSCWASAHRRAFLQQEELSFPRDIGFGEDMLFRVGGLVKAQKIRSVEAALYMYRRNADSVTRKMTRKKMQDICTVWSAYYSQFPKSIIADFYCMNLVSLAELDRNDVADLMPLLLANRKILKNVQSMRAKITRVFFAVFGFYHGARTIKCLVELKND